MFAQSLIEYDFIGSFFTGMREFQIYVGDLPYTTWVIIGGILLALTFLFRYRPR
jgi:hypothetical protein